MPSPEEKLLPEIRVRKPALIAVMAVAGIVAVAALACGSDAESGGGAASGSQNVTAAGNYSIDDLTTAGFKKGKTFDVEGLTSATDAYYGFWGKDPYNRQEYEARFYPSHDDAVQFGTAPAENRTGRGAKLKVGQGFWEEGMKEARQCTRAAGGDSSDCTVSRYGDFVIYGNLVLLCQGRDAATSIDTCNEFLAELEASQSAA